MTIPQSFLDGDMLAIELLPAIAKAEKKTSVVLEFWAGLIGRQLGYMASAIGRERSLQLIDLLRKQIDAATLQEPQQPARQIKPSLSLVKPIASVKDDDAI